MMPRRSPEEIIEDHNWYAFYYNLQKNNSSALEMVLNVIDDYTKTINAEKKPTEEVNFEELLTKNKLESINGVGYWEVSSHFGSYGSYKMKKYVQANKKWNKKIMEKWQWNFSKDLMRYITARKNNEPLFLLPKEIVKNGEEFISQLRMPPQNKYDYIHL